jgi:hypothetical protein
MGKYIIPVGRKNISNTSKSRTKAAAIPLLNSIAAKASSGAAGTSEPTDISSCGHCDQKRGGNEEELHFD